MLCIFLAWHRVPCFWYKDVSHYHYFHCMCVILSQLLFMSPLQRTSEDEWNWGTLEEATSSAIPPGFEGGAQNRLPIPMFSPFQRKYYWSSKSSSGFQLINVSWYILNTSKYRYERKPLWQKVKSLLKKYTWFSLQERHLIQPLLHLRGSNINIHVGSEGFLRCSPGKGHRKITLWPIPKKCTRENIQDTIAGDNRAYYY